MHLESILLHQKTVSLSRYQCYCMIVNHMEGVPMIFQSKVRFLSQKQAFLFMYKKGSLQNVSQG